MATLPSARLYARGFLLSPSPVALFDEVPHYERTVFSDMFLYADTITKTSVASEGDAWCLVVGEAWPLSSGVISPRTESLPRDLLSLQRNGGKDAIADALYDLAGRYAIVIHTEEQGTNVYNDACGTRGVYYNAEARQVASHFDMLDRLAPESSNGEPYGETIKLEKMWDRTANDKVGALIPNFRLILESGEQERFFGLSSNIANDLNPAERIATIERLWKEQLDELVRVSEGRPIAFSMTGGFDSRTSLAMARSHKERFTTFTYTTQSAVDGEPAATGWGRAMQLDYKIVRKLEEFLPRGHEYIARSGAHSRWVTENTDILDRNQTRTHGRWILPGYLALFDDPQTIHLRGNLQEIGRLHMGVYSGSAERRFMQFITFGTKLEPESLEELSTYTTSKYRQHQYDAVSDHYDIGDIWYWEHRHGRWYAEVLNETDTAFETVSLVNVRRILDCYLAFPQEERKSALVQYTLTHRNHPALLFFGINSDTDLYEENVRPRLTREV